jgi:hypothetical protein
MALKPLPYYNPAGYVPGGSKAPVAKAIQRLAFTPQPYGPGTASFDLSGGYYDPQTSRYYKAGTGPFRVPISPTTPWAPNPTTTTTTTGTDTSSGGGTGGGGGSYLDELMSDPMSQAAVSAFGRAIQGGRQSLVDSFKQQIIRGGWGDIVSRMPASLRSQYGGDIDQATIDAANANPLSDRAQLQRGLSQANTANAYELAARGMLQSGDYATGMAQNQNAYDTQSYAGLNQLLDTLGQGASNFAQYSAQQEAMKNQALEAVAQRLAMMQYGANYGGGGGYEIPGQPNMFTLFPQNATPAMYGVGPSGIGGAVDQFIGQGLASLTPAQRARLTAPPKIPKNFFARG